jgi:uncharacterized protein (TIGR03067 family)
MRLLTLLLAGLFAGTLHAADDKKDKPKDEDGIVGKWQMDKIDFGPDTPAEVNKDLTDGYFRFSAEKLVIKFPRDKELREGTYTLDPKTAPKGLDMTMKGDKEKRLALYELDGDTLKLCLTSSDGSPRPTKLEADPKKYVMVVTLKRIKDEKKDK